MSKLHKALSDFDNSLEKSPVEIPGEMGVYIGGKRRVEVTNRPQYVYVRLRTNLSEVIQAFNEKVSPSWHLPVILKRYGNKYIVDRRDINRYQNWEEENKYIPRHAPTHSFDVEGGHVGADPAWIYSYQFMPSLVTPFGTKGAENVFISPYSLHHVDRWIYTGNTGTPSLTDYNPVSGTAILLISIDTVSGNPYLSASTGTYIPSSVTGTHSLLPYVPEVDFTRYLPLSFVTLTSGTSGIGWGNIHDVRQLVGGGGSTEASLIEHNELAGLQGGATGSYFHLQSAQHSGLVGGAMTDLHSHTGTPGAAGDIIFNVDGLLFAITGAHLPYLFTRPTTIESWYIYCENRGMPSGTVITDINLFRTGTTVSIFTDQANRPMLRYEDSDSWAISGLPGIVDFLEGDIVYPDIDQISTGSSGLSVVGKISAVGAPRGLVLTDGVTPISGVREITLGNGLELTDNGNGAVTIQSPGITGRIYLASNSWKSKAGTWVVYPNLAWFYNSSNAVNNYLEYDVYMHPGTYDFYISMPTYTDRGIVDILIDGVSKGTIDQYSASPNESNQGKISGIVVASGGFKTVKFNVSGKNVSSGGYIILFRDAIFVQTA